LGTLLLLGACSSANFVYNRLDFLVLWYVEDYVDLDQYQKQYTSDVLASLLLWHRTHELPDYLRILEQIEDNLSQPQTPEMVASVFTEFEAAWLRLEKKGLGLLLDLGVQLSDEQIDEFMEKLWQRQVEYKEEYLERTDDEFYEDNYEESVDSAREYLGPLSDKQSELLRELSRSLLRSDRVWLQERAEWLAELAVLLERKPGWQERVREAVAARRNNASAESRRVYDHNLQLIYVVIAQLLDGRSEEQDAHLRDRLSSLREDLQALIAEGHGPASEPKPAAETEPAGEPNPAGKPEPESEPEPASETPAISPAG
jgi:6-pyruvoyl-tetrahydropterin synthase